MLMIKKIYLQVFESNSYKVNVLQSYFKMKKIDMYDLFFLVE